MNSAFSSSSLESYFMLSEKLFPKKKFNYSFCIANFQFTKVRNIG